MTTDHAYSVRVKTGSGWRAYKRVRLMISVGKDYHEGKKLAAVVDWINRNPCIEEVHVSVNDLLQRHNRLAAGMPESDAARESLALGALWMARHDAVLAELGVPRLCTRWNDWFGRPDFTGVHAALLSQADQDPLFADAISQDAHALAERKIKRGEPVSAALVAHSRSYVEEELAVFAMQSAELPAAEVYPGSNLQSAAYLQGKQGLPERISSMATRYFARIDFARINVVPDIRARAIARPAA